MSLPFLKSANRNPGVMIQHRASDNKEEENDNKDDGLETCLEEMHAALESRDYKSAAKALKAAFQICDSEPHEEGPHDDYDSMNESAANSND